MARENLDIESGNQSLSGNSLESFDGDEYWKRLSDIKSEKEDAKKEDDVKRMGLMDKLFGRESTDALSDSEIWKKIEYHLKLFQADPDFWNIFENLPPHAKIQEWKSLQKIVTNRVKNAKDRMWDPWIYQAAALLLANIEKWSSPYRWLAGKENTGLWVKALLGRAHYEQFLEDKQICIKKLLSGVWEEKDKIRDVLANCEMDYIVNNIRWGNLELKYFWYHSSIWRGRLSDEFADRLASLSKWWFSRSSVKESYEKNIHTDFDLAKHDFERLMKSSRFPLALGNLAKMLSLSKNDEQKSECQKAFLICMLSGVLDFGGEKDIRNQVYSWAKTLWFLPGMLVENTWHSEQVVALLDDFSKWDFSRHVKSVFHTEDLLKWETNIWNLIDEMSSWWSLDMMNKFEQYSKSDFLTKNFSSDSALGELQKLVSSDIVNIDVALRS